MCKTDTSVLPKVLELTYCKLIIIKIDNIFLSTTRIEILSDDIFMVGALTKVNQGRSFLFAL